VYKGQTKGRERLDNALEALQLLCEPVQPPRTWLEHIQYFCGNTEIAADLLEREPRRVALYKAVVALIRSYARIADELERAGYSEKEVSRIKERLKHYLDLRDIIRNAAEERLDLKPFEADMRHLIDTYIEADTPRKISPFDGIGLLDLIVKTGIAEAIQARLGGLGGSQRAIAETIENNVRRRILKEHLNDPAFYNRMSALLDQIIRDRKSRALEYEQYLLKIAELAKTLDRGTEEGVAEPLRKSKALRALYNNLLPQSSSLAEAASLAEPGTVDYDSTGDPVLDLAMALDSTIKRVRLDSWRGVQAREQMIKKALYEQLNDFDEVERLFPIIKAQDEY